MEMTDILNKLREFAQPFTEGHYPHIKSFDKLYGISDKQQYKDMADDAQSMDMEEFMDTYNNVIDMAADFWEDHQKTSESNEGTVNEDPNTLAKELASEIMRWVRRGFDHIPADALKPKAREYLRSVKKPAVKEDNMQDLAIHDIEAQLGKINDEITFLQIDQKDKESALAALGELRSVLDKYQSQQESAVNELADADKIEFTKVMLDISQIKDRVEALSVDEDAKKSAIQSLTNAEEALVALDESTVNEDIDEKGRIALEKAGFDPMKVKEYMAVFNDHGDTSDIEQMNMDKVGLADAMSMVLASHDIENESYEPFPEEDEMTFEDDDAFYEAFGELGFPEDENELFDAEYRGRKVPLNKPMRGDVKKFKVYVKDPKTGNVKKVNFGHGGSSARKAGQKTMKIRKSNPKARKSFRARHNCANPGPKTRARYWSCRKW